MTIENFGFSKGIESLEYVVSSDKILSLEFTRANASPDLAQKFTNSTNIFNAYSCVLSSHLGLKL
jgi:hypothetical protein